MNKRLAVLAVLLLGLGLSAQAAAADKKVIAAPVDIGDPTASLAQLAKAASCGDAKSPMRLWCTAALGWAKGTAATPPSGSALLGITIAVHDGPLTRDDLLKNVSLSILAFAKGKDGPLVRLTMIKPDNEAEHESLFKAAMALSPVFKGDPARAKIPADLVDYAATMPAKADRALAKGATGWTWMGEIPGEVRKVGDVWLAIERAPDGGYFITMFTDRYGK